MSDSHGGALVLTRRLHKTIHVDGPATITIAKITGGRVTVVLHAEQSTRIMRGELLDREAARQHWREDPA